MSLEETPAAVEAVVRGDGLHIHIPTAYLKRSFQLGLTTGSTGDVTQDMDMLLYFARAVESPEDGSYFGRFIDSVCSEAIENGEYFVEMDEDS